MYKVTKSFYPHIVKQYESVEQFLTENDYTAYRQALVDSLSGTNISTDDETRFKESLSEDGFEAIATIVHDSEEVYNEYLNSIDIEAELNSSIRRPIFEEVFVGESTEHLI